MGPFPATSRSVPPVPPAPACMIIAPPIPDIPSPTDMLIPPPPVVVLLPVSKRIEPEFISPSPVSKLRCPDWLSTVPHAAHVATFISPHHLDRMGLMTTMLKV